MEENGIQPVVSLDDGFDSFSEYPGLIVRGVLFLRFCFSQNSRGVARGRNSMRNWGLAVTLFYALLVIVLLLPGAILLGVGINSTGWAGFYLHLKEAYATWFTWIFVAIPVVGEALLLLLRVDSSQKRLKPRTHIWVSALTVGCFLGILTLAGVLGFGVALRGDKFLPENMLSPLVIILSAWAAWAAIFYRLQRNSEDVVSRAVTWLLRGSVLELLIAVPAHVMVRRRQDCSAPLATSFGITSGLAIMLLSFGPSIVLLYKKRMERYVMKASAYRDVVAEPRD